MPPREHSAASPSGINISGTIGNALLMHARERAVHFFMFVFALDALCRRVGVVNPAVKIAAADAFVVAATHQVDSGFRSKDPVHWGFDEDDPKVVLNSSTSCRNTDAAHFCNLGLEAIAWARLAAGHGGDTHAFDLIEMVKRLAGDTKQLPQRINIGPDRVIDVLHGELAGIYLRAGRPVVSRANLNAYLTAATAAMNTYKAEQIRLKRLGLAACCDVYLDVYANGGDDIWMTLTGYVWAECGARRDALAVADYLDW